LQLATGWAGMAWWEGRGRLRQAGVSGHQWLGMAHQMYECTRASSNGGVVERCFVYLFGFIFLISQLFSRTWDVVVPIQNVDKRTNSSPICSERRLGICYANVVLVLYRISPFSFLSSFLSFFPVSITSPSLPIPQS